MHNKWHSILKILGKTRNRILQLKSNKTKNKEIDLHLNKMLGLNNEKSKITVIIMYRK